MPQKNKKSNPQLSYCPRSAFPHAVRHQKNLPLPFHFHVRIISLQSPCTTPPPPPPLTHKHTHGGVICLTSLGRCRQCRPGHTPPIPSVIITPCAGLTADASLTSPPPRCHSRYQGHPAISVDAFLLLKYTRPKTRRPAKHQHGDVISRANSGNKRRRRSPDLQIDTRLRSHLPPGRMRLPCCCHGSARCGRKRDLSGVIPTAECCEM